MAEAKRGRPVETAVTESHAEDVVDQLWQAYAPFQRGRDTTGDLAFMLAILLLARFVEVAGESGDEFARRWARAVEEARSGVSPLTDLRAVLRSAARHPRFPVPGLADLSFGFADADKDSDDLPWVAAFLTALKRSLTPAEAGWSEICDLLLERHDRESTQAAGEFFTPRPVAHLLTGLASPQTGDRILDPACGSGSLLVAAAQQIASADRIDGDSLEAYATDRSNVRLAMLNLALHDVDRPAVWAADPVSLFQDRSTGLVDRVVSNPPFNQRIEDFGTAGWPFGRPPESKANFAWLQLAWARLSENGLAAMIMPRQAAWSGGRETEIRKAMINSRALMGIIALPPHLFTHTTVPVHIWILARDKARQLPAGDRNAFLFINASQLGTQLPRRPRILTAQDAERIVSRFRQWRQSPRATPDEPGFSRSVPHEEILENDGNLDPGHYVPVIPGGWAAFDTGRVLDELEQRAQLTSDSVAALWESLTTCEQLTRSSIKPPRVPLRTILRGPGSGANDDSTQGLLLAGPSGSLIRAEHYVNAGIPVVMPRDLNGTGFSVAHIRYIPDDQAERLARFQLHLGDVVLARRGELGRCAVVRAEQQGWVCGTGCFLLRPPPDLDADYFASYLRSPEARRWLEAHSRGSTTLPAISLDTLVKLPVILPDLATQQEIADVMTRLDDHEQALRRQLELAAEIRRDALNGLLTSRTS